MMTWWVSVHICPNCSNHGGGTVLACGFWWVVCAARQRIGSGATWSTNRARGYSLSSFDCFICFHKGIIFQFPASREVVTIWPTIFTALCGNDRGRRTFASYHPFTKFLKTFCSTKYLPAMRGGERRSVSGTYSCSAYGYSKNKCIK